MNERRATDEKPHPKAVERARDARLARVKAVVQLLGGIALGTVAIWKLVTTETESALWVLTTVGAFGIASWTSIITAIKK